MQRWKCSSRSRSPPATDADDSSRIHESAVEKAKAAAGEKAVQVVGGASVVQQLLRARLVDELRIDVMPVVLGGGLRLLENIDPELVRLQKIDVQEVGARTSLRFRVVREA